jgi:adenylosuccinate synthase
MRQGDSYAVIGLGFGDEGKGQTVHALSSQLSNPLVIRYSGGQQAGHTVTLKDGTRHVFASFGSGTLCGAPTVTMPTCTVDPVALMTEHVILKELGYDPRLLLSPTCPITTPLEHAMDAADMRSRRHGTCGMGVGKTWAREDEDHFGFHVEDLRFDSVTKMKLELLRSESPVDCTDEEYEAFLEAVRYMREEQKISLGEVPEGDDVPLSPIYEGSQGLLLSQGIGFFPHVTRSHTDYAAVAAFTGQVDHLFLVTRAYQTRHGNGPMTNTDFELDITPNPDETNVFNINQGAFRTSILDADLLRYAIMKDGKIESCPHVTLVVTCCDQVNAFHYTDEGKDKYFDDADAFASSLAERLGCDDYITTSSPSDIICQEDGE